MHLSENVGLCVLGIKFEADETVQEVTLLRARVGDCLVPFLSVAGHPLLPRRESGVTAKLVYFIHVLSLCANHAKYLKGTDYEPFDGQHYKGK